MTEEKTQVHHVRGEKILGNSLLRLRSGTAFVFEDLKISTVASILENEPEIQALGVVTQDHIPLGIISRNRLFSLLGKPFGRDVLAKRPVSEITLQATAFNVYENIFHTAGKLPTTVITTDTDEFYVLKDEKNQYKGFFSRIDLLMYLSEMTQADIRMAGELQGRMVKDQDSWKGKHWQAQALSRSAQGVGGDFYFHKELSGDKHFFCLGDVSGKGVSASILTSLVWGILRTYDYRKGLPRLLHLLNESLIETFHLEKYLTGLFLIWDPESRNLKLADMGHGHSGIWRKNRGLKLTLPKSNLPLGIEKDITPRLFKLTLSPGDYFFAYSDGLTEQSNLEGEEFGEVQLLRVLKKQEKNWKKTPAHLLEAMNQWKEGLPQQDDMTWLQLVVEK